MKTFTLFLTVVFLMVFSQTNYAQSVTREMAKKVARNHFVAQSSLKSSRVRPVEFQKAIAETAGPDTICYILSDTTNRSFIIVSADEKIYPVLAYSDEGTFPDLSNAAPGFLAMLQSQLDEADYRIKNKVPPTEDVVKSWTDLKSGAVGGEIGSVDPLLETKWDQGCYYNTACPYDENSPYCYHVPTGCTATAMAQIMKFWACPLKGIGSHSYTSRYGKLTADFGSNTYNWSKMPNSVTSENNEVAKLMSNLGIALNMDYTTKESSAWKPSVFYEYFGYSDKLFEILRSLEPNFAGYLQKELNEGRPVLYRGDNGVNGHAFVLDGYDGNQFHFNWGWSGTPNTYFYINNLNPNGYNFNYNQSAVIGIQPDNDNLENVINDECDDALELSINDESGGTLKGATRSLSENYCGSNQSTSIVDVWYWFVANSKSHTISVSPSSGLDIVIDLRDGECNGENLACKDNAGGKGKTENLGYNNFIVGKKYLIRIYQDGSKTSDDFTISVSGDSSTTKPDFIVENVQLSKTKNLKPGETVSLTLTVKNLTGIYNYDTYTWAVLSKNDIFEPETDNNFCGIGNPLSNNSISSWTINFQLPSENYSGDWYLLFIVDGGNFFEESDEMNNINVVPISFEQQQNGCSYDFLLSNARFSYQGGIGKIIIETERHTGCTWEFDTDCDFIEFDPIHRGTGPYEISYIVSENPTDHNLTGTIVAKGLNGFEKTFQITLEANPNCSPKPSITSIDVPAEGGRYSFEIVNCDDGFWNITNTCDGMIININPKEGTGTQTVSFDVLPNETEQQQICKLTVQQSGLSVRINQAAKQANVLQPPVIAQLTNIISNGFTASWTSISTATGYILKLATDNTFNNIVTGYSSKDVGNQTKFTFTNLQPNTKYYLRVCCYNACLKSEWSTTEIITTEKIESNITISIGDVAGSEGSIVSVPLIATNLINCAAFQGTIEFDASKLQYQGTENWLVDIDQVTMNPQNDRFSFVYSDKSFSITNGRLFSLKFKVLENEGSSVVKWSDSPTVREFSDAEAKEIYLNYKDGLVTVIKGIVFSGNLIYANNQMTPLSEATIKMSKNTDYFSGITNSDGSFSISLSNSGLYSISAKLKDEWSGASAMDVTKMKRNIAGLDYLTPLQNICADVNGNGIVTVSDITLIKQRILCLISEFPIEDFVTEFSTLNINNAMDITLSGLWAGDVNASWQPFTTKSGNSEFIATLENVISEDGYYYLPLKVNQNALNISSVTIKVKLPQGFKCNAVYGFPDADDLSYNVNQDGELIILYSTLNPFSVFEDNELCIIKLSTNNISLPDRIELTGGLLEIGNSDNEVIDISLLYPSVLNISTGNESHELIEKIMCYPNPAKDYVMLSDLPLNANVQIIDMLGNVKLQTVSSSSPMKIDLSDLTSGVYNIKIIDMNKKSIVSKLVIKK